MARPSPRRMAQALQLATARLGNDDLTPESRASLELTARYYRKHLGESRCLMCGRTLTDPDSIERGYGSECWQRVET